ncbi:hypothetical protein LPW26_03350 [Rhodopseudomonas sp. HC1]|uniref:hypothetical protein n=1 Tax=Rhodopseudomonas infernalis TaxID=2897386 RepID=UPI001EE94A07|nr:hypothetical protein [Rhodopseudomonas infernalis]MCG6203662.1 hypothetical protein [Rhodopseudomonas infernalis]
MTPADHRALHAWQISRGLPLTERYELIDRLQPATPPAHTITRTNAEAPPCRPSIDAARTTEQR